MPSKLILVFLFFTAAFFSKAQDSTQIVTDSISTFQILPTASFKPVMPIDDNPIINGNQQIVPDLTTYRAKAHPAWMVIIILIPLILFAYLRLVNNQAIYDLGQSFISTNIAEQNFRDQESITSIWAIMLMINFMVVASLYLYQLAEYFQIGFEWSGFALFCSILGGVILILIFRALAMTVIGFIFPFREEVGFYRYSSLNMSKMAGLLLYPFVLVMSFGPHYAQQPAIYLSLITVALMLIYLAGKGLIIAKDYILLHPVHFLLYLCTLEIAPILILIKLIDQWSYS